MCRDFVSSSQFQANIVPIAYALPSHFNSYLLENWNILAKNIVIQLKLNRAAAQSTIAVCNKFANFENIY